MQSRFRWKRLFFFIGVSCYTLPFLRPLSIFSFLFSFTFITFDVLLCTQTAHTTLIINKKKQYQLSVASYDSV